MPEPEWITAAMPVVIAAVIIGFLSLVGRAIVLVVGFIRRVVDLLEHETSNGSSEEPSTIKDLLTGILNSLKNHHKWAQEDAKMTHRELASIRETTDDN